MVNPLRLAAAAWRGVVTEYRRQQHPERDWFHYARIGSAASAYTIGLPEGWTPLFPDAAAGDD